MGAMKKIQRILLKLSGEQFAGTKGFGIDMEFITELAQELHELVRENTVQVAIVVGGGNFLRGAMLSSTQKTIERATADYMGMLATVLNGMALVDTLEFFGQPARLQTRIRTDSVAEPYIRRRAVRHLEKGRVVIVAGGTGNPYVTTDTAAVSTALELECDAVLKATKVDGVYTADPAKHAGAQKITELSHLEVLQNQEIKVMDNAAVSLAMEQNLPIIVFDLLKKGNIQKVVRGEAIGTRIDMNCSNT